MTTPNRPLSLIDASVSSIMTRQIKIIEVNKPLVDCVRMMRDANIGSVVVVENGNPIGIFTERDFIKKIADGMEESLELKMSQVMSKPLTTVSSNATIWDALMLMGRRDIRRLPIVDNDKLVGILTERDVFRLILSQQSLLLESMSEYIPMATKEELKKILAHLGTEKPPTRVGRT